MNSPARFLAAALALTNCATLVQSPHVARFTDRDSTYLQWYRELERCSGIKGDFYRITFYTTTDHLRLGHTFDGYWEPGSIVLRKPWEREAVLHEMMHDLLQTNQHPRQFFNGRCGDLTRGEV